METGTKISAIAHVGLIGWAFFGGTFRSEPLPMAVQDVSVITSEQFAAMTAQRDAPEVPVTPTALQQPDTPETPANIPEPIEDVAPAPEPDTPSEPEPEVAPELVETPPEPELVEEPPTLDQPDPEVTVLPVPPGPEAQSRPVDRVAPEPVAPPPPEAKPDDVETPPVSEDEGAEVPQEQQEQTAPDEANDQIVTEAEESQEVAPLTSPRPRTRPNRPQPPAQPEVAEASEPVEEPVQNNEAAINDALAEALGQGSEPSGPPLTRGEKDAMRLAVAKCWNLGSSSTEALRTTVLVGFSLSPEGRVIGSSLRLLSSSSDSDAATKIAFEAARRAILRCGASGYDLPADKYAQWKDIEITFNPGGVGIR